MKGRNAPRARIAAAISVASRPIPASRPAMKPGIEVSSLTTMLALSRAETVSIRRSLPFSSTGTAVA